MEAILGVTTCDKCGKRMKKGEAAVIVAEGVMMRSGTDATWQSTDVRYACHRDCWDGVEEIEE